MIFKLLVIGFVSLLAQIALMRELAVAFFGVELIYILALGVWLFATAMGALAGRRMHLPSREGILILLILFGIVLPLNVLFIRSTRMIFAGVPGAYLMFPQQMTAMILAMLPSGFLSGLLFQWAAKRYVAQGRTLAAAYAVECVGGLIGGLLATLCLHGGVQNFVLLLYCSLAALLPFLHPVDRQKNRVLNVVAIVVAAILAATLWHASLLDGRMTAWTHPHMLDSRDSPYGRLTVTKQSGQVAVFENDALVFETEGTEAEIFVHLAALQHARPMQVLILGGGMDGTLPELLQHHPQHVDDVELNPLLQTLVAPNLPVVVREALENSKVRLVFADPRQFLLRSDRYDLILVGMPEPSSGQSNRFYTQDFFTLCAARLNPQGILALRLPSSENYWTPQMTRRTASIYRALAAVFEHILILPGTTDIITASAAALPAGPEIMAQRLKSREIRSRFITPPYLDYLFTNDRFFAARQRLQTSEAPANTDNRPVCYAFAVMVWLSNFFPQSAFTDMTSVAADHPGGRFFWWLPFPLLALLFYVSRRRLLWRSVFLVGAAGFLGMVQESILLLHYQLKHGVLFQDIGILLTLFMTGLALGAATVNHVLLGTGAGEKLSKRLNIVLLAGFALICLFTSWIIGGGGAMGLAQTAGWLAATGFCVAGLFAAVSFQNREHQAQVIAKLYAADMVGASVGSLLAGLIMIPLLGLDLTAQAMLTLALLALLLV